ncbi:hypothetical protein [Hyphomicrobium methylovorum]|uniref:hypothetical protein n=1 Tax=Hyphomicrobium methylovorum TaxID=84 RepID=UPI0015E71CD9|nr:hypothetical protein [Hyphomicrobium methylovorum]
MSTTALAARPRSEPEDRDDPRNRLLDAFDAQIEALIDNGFEAQVRARVERHLPPISPEPDLFVPQTAGFVCAAEDELKLQILAGDLKRLAKLKMTEHAHDAVKRVRTWVEQQLEAAKQARAKA